VERRKSLEELVTMSVLQWAIAFWVAAGLMAFSAWTVSVWARTSLPPRTDRTSWLVYQSGRAFVWLAAILSAGAIFGIAARSAWMLVQ
jgi:hypothetical protein